MLNRNDIYAGKLCAALGRQHPRDLFDMKILFEHEGIIKELMSVFLVYLISGNRPIAEILEPRQIPLVTAFNEQFVGIINKDKHSPLTL